MARFLALDWDQNQLHIVAAKVSGGKVTVQQAIVLQEEKSPNPVDASALGQLLRERLKAAKIAPAPVLACVGRDRLILKEVRYPAVSEAEEAGLVRFQAVKELTDSADDVVLDYVPVGDRKAPELRSLALIVRREFVHSYQTLCQSAGLKLAALTPRPFGLAASARKVIGTTALTPSPEPPDGAIAVVALSGRWAEFCVLQGDAILQTRTLTISPHLAGEIRRNLAVFAGQAGRPTVRALYLTGAYGTDLRERLADLTDLPLHSFDPFAGNEGLTLPAAERGGFAGAAGLLYARAATGTLPINFVQPRQPRKQEDPTKRRLVLAALLLLFVFFAATGFGLAVQKPDLKRKVESAKNDLTDLEDKSTRLKEEANRYKALDAWDSPVWLDEFYDLTALINDTNALRVTEITGEPIPRSAKSPYAAKLTVKGTLSGGSRKPYEDLISKLNKEGFYNYLATPSKVENNNQFTLVVEVKRRAPGEHKQVLKSAPKKEVADGFGLQP